MTNHVIVLVRPLRVRGGEWVSSSGCAGVVIDGVEVPGTVISANLAETSDDETATVLLRIRCGKFETVDAAERDLVVRPPHVCSCPTDGPGPESGPEPEHSIDCIDPDCDCRLFGRPSASR